MRAAKRVWILGAGFSRSLGGPLLCDLISEEAVRIVRSTFPNCEGLKDECFDSVLRVYDKGKSLWPDPEAFLVYLETAVLGEEPAETIVEGIASDADPHFVRNRNGKQVCHDLAFAARRLIAGRCLSFCRREQAQTEQWAPYRHWVRQLTSEDVIVSFNYDPVVEVACEGSPSSHVEAVIPGLDFDDTAVRLLKLHGSATWRFDRDSGMFFPGRDHDFAMRLPDAMNIGIGVPGPAKAGVAKALHGLWRQAEKALEEADTVFFLGYRFPPSDAHARTSILGALSATSKKPLTLVTVLGDDIDNPSTRRLRGLLKFAMKKAGRRTDKDGGTNNRYALFPAPMFVQDFIDLADEKLEAILPSLHVE